MKIAVITYDHPHQKTQDLVCRLKLNGYRHITLVVLPWTDRKNHVPLYTHRPDNPVCITIEQLCDNLSVSYFRIYSKNLDTLFLMRKFDKILIGGAGILQADVIKYNIINTHPGYLPYIRGLDALKWAILNGEPIGVTTYFIGEKPDTGILIERRFVPIYSTDSFHSIARRQYEIEIDMMVGAVTAIPDGMVLEEKAGHELNRRMCPRDELRMMERCKRLISGI